MINVRLEAEDAQRVKALRGAGVQLSSLVRDAIRSEYEKRLSPKGKRKPSAVLAEILAALPDDDEGTTRIETTDRHAVKRHIASKLRSRS